MFNEGDEFSFEEIKMATGVGKEEYFLILKFICQVIANYDLVCKGLILRNLL